MRTIAVIPARYRSKRLPGKPLADLQGKTMVERVYERALGAELVDDVLVATDDERIRDAVARFGGQVVMTSSEHPSGTDRIAEVVRCRDVDHVVNVQGDEPLIDPAAIDDAVRLARTHPGAMATLRRSIARRARLLDENVVKVVVDDKGFALYFSRSPIPCPPPPERGNDDRLEPGVWFEHVGLYVYPKDVLLELAGRPPVALERIERLEQLRALTAGVPIRVGTTDYESISVDTEEDLARVRELLASAIPVDSGVES
jgi:3-deoxy-manno-octulosonate cytidylyltransferase (CMP-KDO synthetase)